jgi:hypothetical protein
MLFAALFALHRVAHQICNDRARFLPPEDCVECILDVFRNAEIDGGQAETLNATGELPRA